jgi:flagella basal body P-ring formation protein FlgA
MIFFALMLCSMTPGTITLSLPEAAQVRGQELRLGALARIEGAGAADAARLSAIALGYTPSPGFARVITRADIADKVRSALPGTTVEFVGSERCRIEVETQAISGESVRAEATRALRAALGGRDATLTADGVQTDLVVPRSEKAVELRAQPDTRALRSGTVSVPVQVWVDGAPYQTVQSSFRVEAFAMLPVLATDVRRGDVLETQSVELRRVRVDAELAGEPLSPAALPGAMALRDMQKGSVLTDRDVQRAQLVKQGDLVQIQVKKGAVVARATAIAAQDGCLGDKVRVITADSKRELAAVVTGAATVEVDLTGKR